MAAVAKAKAVRASVGGMSAAPNLTTTYVATPTFQKFHTDNSLVRAVMGPVGSGKSVGMCLEMLYRAQSQAPHNGVRRTRWAVIRSSYRELKTTTIKTFRDWLGHLGTFTWDSPIRFNAEFPLYDGTRVSMEVLFFPVDKVEDIESLKSLELTGVWINEAISLDPAALQVLRGRIRRYPAERDGGYTWSGIIMDTNPPPTDHWFYKLFEVERPANHRIFHQPPPIFKNADGSYSPNPDAENIENHASGYFYYLDQIPGATEEYIKVFVLGEYGSVHAGKAVFERFSERRHVSRTTLTPHRSQPIVLGADFGLNPAIVFLQPTPTGQLLAVDEVTAFNIGYEDFLDELLIPKIQQHYAGYSFLLVGDPTGVNRNAQGMVTAFDMVRQRGLAATEAPTNDIQTRLNAVHHFLGRNDGFLVDRKCVALIDALSGGYQLARSASGAFRDMPDKRGKASHIADALQYGCLYYFRGAVRAPTREQRSLRHRPKGVSKPYAYA